jgi:membrane-bound lytic murein transglycosylase B
VTKFLTKVLLISICATAYCSGSSPASTTEISDFKQSLVTRFKFKTDEINHVMQNAKYNPKVISLMESPYEKKSYTEYRKLFVSPTKIANGKKFIKENKPYLDSIATGYDIPVEIIAAIIGVESNYKPIKTNYHTLDSLYTLAFHYPKRSKFFKYELEQFLLLCRDLKVSPESITGSYAGALGIPQFMPSNYRHLAKTTKKQYPDLFNSQNDAIISIANYLHHFGWVKNQAPAMKVAIAHSKLGNTPAINKVLTISELNSMGITTDPAINKNTKTRVLDTHEAIQNNMWLGLTNLKVIKSYNNSDLYALAVFELAQSIKDQA